LIVNINVLHLPTQKHSANKLTTVAFFSSGREYFWVFRCVKHVRIEPPA